MLCYRLIHYTDDLPQIKISVINRDEELTYPLLQLFYGTEAFEEIKTAVEFFLNQRRQRRSTSMEAALYPILKDLIINSYSSSNFVDILYSSIWNKITTEKSIKGNLVSNTQYDTLEYESLHQNTLSKFIADKFTANLRHGEEGSILTFDKEKFDSYDQVYNHKVAGSGNDVKIGVEVVKQNPDGTEGTEGSLGGLYNFESENNNKKK